MLEAIGLLVILFIVFVVLKMIRMKIYPEYELKVRKRIFESDPTEVNQWDMWQAEKRVDRKRYGS